MPRRIDLARALLILGSALLFISLFVEWYDTGATGWEVFESLDLVLAAIALAGIAVALRPDALPPWAAWALPFAALLIVVVQIVNVPPAAGVGDPSTGAWVALAGSVLMAVTAAMSLAAISVTVQVRERELRRRVAAVDRRSDREAGAEGPTPGQDDEAGDGGEDGATGLWDRRSGRLGPRQAPRPMAGTPAPSRPETADPERTQPLTGLPDGDPEDTERP
jgi:hypothetical protein